MALAFHFAPAAFSTQAYDDCTKQLRKAGAGNPTGRMYHACFGTNDRVEVFDVWTSQSAFDKFGKTLMPILQGLGVDPGQPRVIEVHNVVVPPARPRPAAKKRAPAKRKSAARKRRR